MAAAAPTPPKRSSQGPRKLAVFVSGGGSNFQAIHTACQEGRINGDVVAVVSDVPSCGAVAYAQLHNLPTFTYPASKKSNNEGLTVEELVQLLHGQLHVDLVLLAGYLKLVPAEVVRQFPGAMLNVHPALLPAFGGKGFYGKKVHQAVIACGARFSGPTVHFVDEEYDRGPILAQRVVPVYPSDTPEQLAARVLKEEHLVYPEAVAALCDGRVTWREDGVPIMWSAH